MNILALDLATKMGWACIKDGKITHGAENLALKRDQMPGQLWSNFRTALNRLATPELHAVYFERVMAHGQGGSMAAHLYGGWLAHLEHWAHINNIPLHPVGVLTIKKHFAGTGKADKDAMIAEARRRGFHPADHNAADALGILSFGLFDQDFIGPVSAPHANAILSPKQRKVARHVEQDSIPF